MVRFGVVTVHENDTRELGRNAEPRGEVGDGRALGKIDAGAAVGIVFGRKIRNEGREELDLDYHLAGARPSPRGGGTRTPRDETVTGPGRNALR